jgi:flagellar protein FlaI
MLGWRILGQGEYLLDLPSLSRDEEELILATQERFKEATRTHKADGKAESEALVGTILDSAAKEMNILLEKRQETYLKRIAAMHIYGFGFMEPLLKDPSVEEISIIGPEKPAHVYIRKTGWKKVNACFTDEKAIGEMINRMGRSLGRHITMQNPRLDAMLPDGSRLHASLPPISMGEITLRRFRDNPFTPKELAENKTISSEALAFLSALMQCDCSLLIAGNTASGKTTTLNALFSFIPGNERIIITEETPEINLPHKHQMRLVANRDMGITLKDLVYDTLRMRPDRMVVGEVRNKDETEALFDVLLAGQARGSYATFHAQSADEALSRLQSFGVRKEDLGCIDCIVVQRRMLRYDSEKRKNSEVRRVVEIAEIDGSMDGIRTIYRDGKPMRQGRLLEKMADSFGLSREKMAEELLRREKIIMGAPEDFNAFYRAVQKDFFGLEG